jgi:hypothetical protein
MPIRLNLLSEARAHEELRRKDPVKRAIWIGVLLIMLVLAWSSSLQVGVVIAKGDLTSLNSQIAALTNSYSLVVANQKKLADTDHKIAALRQLAANRFLQGPVLNALQKTVIDNVQLTRLRTEQSYAVVEATKASTNANNKVTAKPAKATEKIAIVLEARDTAPTPGDQVPRFQQLLSDNPFLQELLGRTNQVRLASLSAPQFNAGTKPFVSFSLECRLPERIR